MEGFWDFVKAFVVGGLICVIGQVLIQTTKLTNARILVLFVTAGVVLTGASAAYPYGVDPRDSNIRLAPTYPAQAEVEEATRLLCVALRLATVEHLLAR